MPEGITVDAVVVSSPWPPAEHWQYLAEQERDHKNEIAVRLRQFERICEGLPQDAIDGCWTVQGIRCYAKRLEDQLKSALARVAELEKQEPVAWMHDQPNRVDIIHRDVKELLQRVPGSNRGIHRPLDVSEHYTIPLYAAPVAQAQQLHDLDKQCRDDVARALGLRPSQERGFAWSYLLASIKSCVKASGDSAQAQHSVPDVQAVYDALDFRERMFTSYENVSVVLAAQKRIAAAPGAAEAQALREEVAALRRDKARLDAIEDNCWDVRHGSSSNAHAGDSSIGIEIVGYYQGAPHIRVLGESYTENLRAAIDQAMTAEAYPPERPEYDDHGRPLRALLSEQE